MCQNGSGIFFWGCRGNGAERHGRLGVVGVRAVGGRGRGGGGGGAGGGGGC